MSASEERRAGPRVPVTRAYLRLLSREPAQIVDVGAGGALLETSAVVLPGASGRLEARLKQRTFGATVQVSHVRQAETRGGGAKAGVGVAFVSMDADSREALAHFLGSARASKSS